MFEYMTNYYFSFASIVTIEPALTANPFNCALIVTLVTGQKIKIEQKDTRRFNRWIEQQGIMSFESQRP